MPHVFRKIVAALAGVILLASLGCQGGASVSSTDASTEKATVKGKVTLRDKPVTDGQVSFDPANVSRKVGAFRAPIDKEGNYTIQTYLGGNRITVESSQLKSDDLYSETTFDVKAGENSFDITIPKK